MYLERKEWEDPNKIRQQLIGMRVGTVRVFDKTGTLTYGKPEVTDVALAPGTHWNVDQLLIFAGSLEKGSEHPLGIALTAEAKRRGLKLSSPNNFRACPGFGVEGLVNEKKIVGLG